jgi:hypothetical protein
MRRVMIAFVLSQLACNPRLAQRNAIDAQAIATRDLHRDDCGDEIELESTSGGYIAKACGRWEEISCPDPWRSTRGTPIGHCRGEGVMKIYPPPLKTAGPWSGELIPDDRGNVVVMVKKDGRPIAARFAITSRPGALAPIEPIADRTGADGVATLQAASLIAHLLPEPDIAPLHSEMPDVILEVADQAIEIKGALLPIYRASFAAASERRRGVVDGEIRTETCTAPRRAKLDELGRGLRRRFGWEQQLHDHGVIDDDAGTVSRLSVVVAREPSVNVEIDTPLETTVEVVALSSEPVTVTAPDATETDVSRSYAKSIAQATGFHTSAIELYRSVAFTETALSPFVVDVRGRGCTLIVPITRLGR